MSYPDEVKQKYAYPVVSCTSAEKLLIWSAYRLKIQDFL